MTLACVATIALTALVSVFTAPGRVTVPRSIAARGVQGGTSVVLPAPLAPQGIRGSDNVPQSKGAEVSQLWDARVHVCAHAARA